MTSQLVALCIGAADPPRLAAFWGGLLGWSRLEDDGSHDGVELDPGDEVGFLVRFVPTDEPRTGPNQMHPDLTSTSLEDQQQTVARALRLGGRHLDVGQLPEEEHVVLADPEDNEFCVIEPGNGFLAGCGRLGCLASDGSQAVGYFWSRALGWPLVWDQDEETAIQSPRGGTKISWGGPPVRPKTGRNRWHLDLAPPAGADQRSELERLLALGAARTDVPVGDAGRVELLDPDGNEFCLLAAR